MKKVILSLIIIPILVILLIIGNFIYTIEFKPVEIETINNDNNNYKVVFKSIGEPSWSFGPQKVKVIIYKNNKKIKTYNRKIFNDGAQCNKENFMVIWLDDRMKIVLSGDEQNDEIIEYKY